MNAPLSGVSLRWRVVAAAPERLYFNLPTRSWTLSVHFHSHRFLDPERFQCVRACVCMQGKVCFRYNVCVGRCSAFFPLAFIRTVIPESPSSHIWSKPFKSQIGGHGICFGSSSNSPSSGCCFAKRNCENGMNPNMWISELTHWGGLVSLRLMTTVITTGCITLSYNLVIITRTNICSIPMLSWWYHKLSVTFKLNWLQQRAG